MVENFGATRELIAASSTQETERATRAALSETDAARVPCRNLKGLLLTNSVACWQIVEHVGPFVGKKCTMLANNGACWQIRNLL